jgi:hypothetical protein
VYVGNLRLKGCCSTAYSPLERSKNVNVIRSIWRELNRPLVVLMVAFLTAYVAVDRWSRGRSVLLSIDPPSEAPDPPGVDRQATEAVARQVQVTNLTYAAVAGDGTSARILGTIRNRSRATIAGIRLEFAVISPEGRLLDVETYEVESFGNLSLAPGRSADFAVETGLSADVLRAVRPPAIRFRIADLTVDEG